MFHSPQILYDLRAIQKQIGGTFKVGNRRAELPLFHMGDPKTIVCRRKVGISKQDPSKVLFRLLDTIDPGKRQRIHESQRIVSPEAIEIGSAGLLKQVDSLLIIPSLQGGITLLDDLVGMCDFGIGFIAGHPLCSHAVKFLFGSLLPFFKIAVHQFLLHVRKFKTLCEDFMHGQGVGGPFFQADHFPNLAELR